MLTSMSTTLALVTAPISIAVVLLGGALWATALQALGADLSNRAWDLAVFPLWFLTVCGWGLLLRVLAPGPRAQRG
jgi:hypothetical protein